MTVIRATETNVLTEVNFLTVTNVKVSFLTVANVMKVSFVTVTNVMIVSYVTVMTNLFSTESGLAEG